MILHILHPPVCTGTTTHVRHYTSTRKHAKVSVTLVFTAYLMDKPITVAYTWHSTPTHARLPVIIISASHFLPSCISSFSAINSPPFPVNAVLLFISRLSCYRINLIYGSISDASPPNWTPLSSHT